MALCNMERWITALVSLAFILVIIQVTSARDKHEGPSTKATDYGFVNISGTEYFISYIDGPWQDAVQLCNEMDMKLLSMETMEKAQQISTFLSYGGYAGRGAVFWTSGHKINDFFVWTGVGERFSFDFWRDYEPKDDTAEPCVFLDFTIPYVKYEWSALNCSAQFPSFICEHKP